MINMTCYIKQLRRADLGGVQLSVGQIIKFYREREGMTQAQLGEGICTATHISKIENSKTDYSPEIISLFSQRLNINIHKEIEAFDKIESMLHCFHEAMIMNQTKQMENYRKSLGAIPYITSTKYSYFFQLLMGRYWLMKLDKDKVDYLLKKIEPVLATIYPYEQNLFLHLKGIYYIKYSTRKSDHFKAIAVLNKINIKYYPNPEYYYHLALAYEYVGSRVISYFYAEKALSYFKETNNYLQAIKAESLILLQMSDDEFIEVEEKYKRLIHACDLIGAIDKKGMLLNNLGISFLKRKQFNEAYDCLNESLKLTVKQGATYINRLANYIEICIEGNLNQRKILIKKAEDGYTIAKKEKNYLFVHLFQLFIFVLSKETKAYFMYLEENAYPYFRENQHLLLMKKYSRQLLSYYHETNQIEKRANLACEILEEVMR